MQIIMFFLQLYFFSFFFIVVVVLILPWSMVDFQQTRFPAGRELIQTGLILYLTFYFVYLMISGSRAWWNMVARECTWKKRNISIAMTCSSAYP